MRVVVIHTPTLLTPHTHARLCSRFSTLHSPFYILHSAGCGKGCEKCSPLSLFGWGMCPVGFTTSTYIAKWTHTCHIYTHIHICMYKGVVVGHMANGGWLGGWVNGWMGGWAMVFGWFLPRHIRSRNKCFRMSFAAKMATINMERKDLF